MIMIRQIDTSLIPQTHKKYRNIIITTLLVAKSIYMHIYL